MRARTTLSLLVAATAAVLLSSVVPASAAADPSRRSWLGRSIRLVEHQVDLVQIQLAQRERMAAIAAMISEPPPPPPPVTDPSTFVVPAVGPVSSRFGQRWGRPHTGVDIDAPHGAPVVAAQAGTVVLAGWKNGYGNTVVIDHGSGLRTLYAHQSTIRVRTGALVARGEPIGAVGATGQVTGANLHYEVLAAGVPRDPVPWL